MNVPVFEREARVKVFVTFECAFERWCSSDFHNIHVRFECSLSDILVSTKDLIEILALHARTTLRTLTFHLFTSLFRGSSNELRLGNG